MLKRSKENKVHLKYIAPSMLLSSFFMLKTVCFHLRVECMSGVSDLFTVCCLGCRQVITVLQIFILK